MTGDRLTRRDHCQVGSAIVSPMIPDAPHMRAAVFGLCLLGVGCAAPIRAPDSSPPRTEAAQPTARLTDLEQRLLSSPVVRIAARIRSTGAVRSDFVGHLELAPVNRAWVSFSGEFAGRDAQPRIDSTGGTDYRCCTPTDAVARAIPVELNRALLVGFARMGLLHNLARLSAGSGPDHADGGVQTWLRTVTVGQAALKGFPAVAGASPLTYDLQVDGVVSARMTLWIGVDGMPRARHAVVTLKAGEMRVEETYDQVSLLQITDKRD